MGMPHPRSLSLFMETGIQTDDPTLTMQMNHAILGDSGTTA